MYYILLALITEQCGVDIMSRVEKISRGRITVGPGTVYALLDKFLTSGLIRETRVDGRRRSYVITDLGKEFLRKEQDRLHQMLHDGETRSEGELK